MNDVPLPVPTDDAARALHMCTLSSNSSSTSYVEAPTLNNMLPIWNSHFRQNIDAFDPSYQNNDRYSDADYGFSSVVCGGRPVSELVQLCIMDNVSALNAVLLMHTLKPMPSLHLLPYIQARSPISFVKASV